MARSAWACCRPKHSGHRAYSPKLGVKLSKHTRHRTRGASTTTASLRRVRLSREPAAITSRAFHVLPSSKWYFIGTPFL